DRVLAALRRMLQLEHRVGIEQVELAGPPPLVLAAPVEVGLDDGPCWIGVLLPLADFFRDDVDADAADAGSRPREVAIHERRIEADGLENLRAAIALERRDAHLGHHLEDALVERSNVILHRLLVRDTDEQPLLNHVVERLEREIRVDDARAVPEQQRAVMHLARVARLDDERAARPRALANQMMVNARSGEQTRDWSAIAVGAAVRQDQDRVAR